MSRSGTSALTSARDRDILLCLVSCSLQLGVRRLTVPASLVLDECSRWPLTITITIHLSARLCLYCRLYILEQLQQPGHCAQLESLVCECYTSNLVRWGGV